MKVIPLSHVLHTYYMIHEMYSRIMADSENKTDMQNGPHQSPAVLSFVVKITSLILDTKTFSHMIFLDDVSDLQKYLEPHVSNDLHVLPT
ncbi:hypothetical protein COOONC_03123 [Cooperia oncophora]